jgi:hypothetical protein
MHRWGQAQMFRSLALFYRTTRLEQQSLDPNRRSSARSTSFPDTEREVHSARSF